MSVLADTSIWIDYLREGASGRAAPLDALLEANEVVVCGPVVAEILAGATKDDRERLGRLFSALPWAPIDRGTWLQVGEVAARLRDRGETVPLTDIQIAVAAASGDAQLWARDTDFDRIEAVLPELGRYSPE